MTVYLIGSSGLREVKIGFTGAKVEDRMADLQTGCPYPLQILDQLPGGKELEKAAHTLFAQYRTHGEWFDFGDQDPTTLFRSFATSTPLLTAPPPEAVRPLADDIFELPHGPAYVPAPGAATAVADPVTETDQGATPVAADRNVSSQDGATPVADPLSDRIAEAVNQALDGAGRFFAPAAAAWKAAADAREAQRTPESLKALRDANVAARDTMRDLRRDRKAFEKARDEVEWWNVVNGERRAARLVVKDSRELAREARAARREARRNYPVSLPALAARCHVMHMAPTAVWAAVSDSYAATGAFSASVAAVALNIAGVALGSRYLRGAATAVAPDALQPTQEEADLLQRLDPKQFARLAEPRGLSDVVSAGGKLTKSGIQVKLTLNNTMDLPKLVKMQTQLRAVLRLREGTRLELREGSTGGHARLTLRTRSAASGDSLKGWKPGDPWAINTVTGEPVYVPLGRRMLTTGTSGAGKSWSMRPVLAEASAYEDHVLVVIDAKQVEAKCWEHRARTAVTNDEILDVTDELVAEMHERLAEVPRGEDTIKVSVRRPRITVFVDEGSEVIGMSKDKGQGEDKIQYSRIIENLRTLARMGRAAEIIILWASQKVTMTGQGYGIDSQIAAQITCRASLCVATPAEARITFGEDAIEKGWLAHELPMPGVAMLRDSNTAKPHHLLTRAFSPKDVIDLPAHRIWSRRASSTGATVADIQARKALEAAVPPGWTSAGGDDPTLSLAVVSGQQGAGKNPAPRMAASDRDDQVLSMLRADPCRTLSSLANEAGTGKATIKNALDRMAVDGLVMQDDDGCWHVVE